MTWSHNKITGVAVLLSVIWILASSTSFLLTMTTLGFHLEFWVLLIIGFFNGFIPVLFIEHLLKKKYGGAEDG